MEIKRKLTDTINHASPKHLKIHCITAWKYYERKTKAENRNKMQEKILTRQQNLPHCGTKDHSEPQLLSIHQVQK